MNSTTAGLDVKQRPRLIELLHEHHARRDPLVVLGLRQHDPLPQWITHLAIADGEDLLAKDKSSFAADILVPSVISKNSPTTSSHTTDDQRSILVDVKGLNIKYADRKVRESKSR